MTDEKEDKNKVPKGFIIDEDGVPHPNKPYNEWTMQEKIDYSITRHKGTLDELAKR